MVKHSEELVKVFSVSYKQRMLTNTQKLAFTAISEFVNALSESFGSGSGSNRIGSHQRPLDLYARLLVHVNPGVAKPEIVVKHISCFSDYIVRNMKDILAKRKPVDQTLKYNDRIYLPVNLILDKSDPKTVDAIWTHLLTITTLLFPDSQARELLTTLESSPVPTNEEKVVHEMIAEISPMMDENAGNPIAIATKLMKNGSFMRMVKNMEQQASAGQLDIHALVGTAMKMFQTPGEISSTPLSVIQEGTDDANGSIDEKGQDAQK